MRRASWIILFAVVCFAAVGFGFALGFVLDAVFSRR